jgi:mRNA-degrading endonuclease RelE of RelBE toxin-antitoxin system
MPDMTVLQMPLFKRVYKKLKRNQQEAADKAISVIIKNPEIGKQKRGDLNGVYVYKFDCINKPFLLAYEWNPDTRILLALGVHENFYRDLKRST